MNSDLEKYKSSFRPRWQDFEDEYDIIRERQRHARNDFPVWKMIAVLAGLLIWMGVVWVVKVWLS